MSYDDYVQEKSILNNKYICPDVCELNVKLYTEQNANIKLFPSSVLTHIKNH